MSRSYREPWVKSEGGGKRFFKKKYNKSLRQEKDIPTGNFYKKMRDTYSISDFRWIEPNNEKLRRK